MKVFVIIVTYNAVQWIDKCFGNLTNSSIPIDIMAIDNNSTDNTIEVLTTHYPNVIIRRSTENLGFGKANNLGIRHAIAAGADYIFLLNQDSWLDAAAIEGLIAIHKKNPDFGILSPIHLNGSGSALDFRFSISFNDIDCPNIVSDIYLRKAKNIYPISFANAAFWLISKECILKAGVFDPIFPHYGEDTDYVNRIRYHGFKIGVCPGFYGFHDRETRAPSEKRDRTLIEVGYLSNLKDINRNFFNAFSSFLSFFTTTTLKKILRGKIASVFLDFKFLFSIIILIPVIMKTRRVCEKPSAYL